jgi:peptidoglycan/xylan/chitin deacetylase (PgdA/CDA1 family)
MTDGDMRPGTYEPARGLKAKLARRATQWRAAAPVWVWPDRPTLSISFDDFPKSAAHNGMPVLAAHGARATYYACAGLMGQDSPFGPMYGPEEFRAVIAAGHEIACHTNTHLDCARASDATVEAECEANAQGLAALGLNSPLAHVAYPYGETRPSLKRVLANRFATARGIMPGLNVARVDRMQLRALPFYGPDADRDVLPWLARAKALRAWLIVLTHDVADEPSRFGCSPGALDRLLAQAAALGFAVAPVGEAYSRFTARRGP